MTERTSTYKFTVQMKDGKPVGDLVQNLRDSVKKSNVIFGTKKYVKLQGRGPRPSPRYHISLPLSMSEYADVYVYDRNY